MQGISEFVLYYPRLAKEFRNAQLDSSTAQCNSISCIRINLADFAELIQLLTRSFNEVMKSKVFVKVQVR